MVPASTVFIVGDDDDGAVPPDMFVLLNSADNISDVPLALRQTSITRMLVVRPKRLDKTHRWQVTTGQIAEKSASPGRWFNLAWVPSEYFL